MRLPFILAVCASCLTSVLSTIEIADTDSTYKFVTKHNDQLSPLLRDLCASTDFFKYYKLNLFTRECPYFNEDGAFCGNRACAVDTIEEEDVPEIWRASILGKLSGPSATAASNLPLRTNPSKPRDAELSMEDGDSSGETCVQDPLIQDDRNFCVAEDEGSECVYVSLADNEERYTGYHGAHAHAIWGSIYRENCFDSHVAEQFKAPKESTEADFSASSALKNDPGFGSQQFQKVLQDPVLSGHGIQDTCVEKRIFYRIISGMHASISAHICAQYLNQLSGRWEPNSTCFDHRLRSHPERISNIYFNYVLVSRAIAKLSKWLESYTFCSGDPAHDAYTHTKVSEISSLASRVRYDETPLFEDRLLKEDFRNRFRNISMLMDCVGCDKCRLWGKVQVAGYGTALKILFDDDPAASLRRGEIVALFNTYGRLSISLDALKLFNYTMPGSVASSEQDKKHLSEDHEESIIEVSDSQVSEEQVLTPHTKNPTPDHAGPKAPFDRLQDAFTGALHILRPLIHYIPTFPGLRRDIKTELSEFARALKYLGKSYIDLPKTIWYRLFVVRSDASSSFWQFVFDAQRRDKADEF